MGRREFYGWVNQVYRELFAEHGHVLPDSWAAAEQDEWWNEKRRRRDELMGRH